VVQAAWRLRSSEQVIVLAGRLRAVLEHTRDRRARSTLLALAEAFLEALQPAGPPDRQTALAFSLIYDYTVGFALSDGGTGQRTARAGCSDQAPPSAFRHCSRDRSSPTPGWPVTFGRSGPDGRMAIP